MARGYEERDGSMARPQVEKITDKGDYWLMEGTSGGWDEGPFSLHMNKKTRVLSNPSGGTIYDPSLKIDQALLGHWEPRNPDSLGALFGEGGRLFLSLDNRQRYHLYIPTYQIEGRHSETVRSSGHWKARYAGMDEGDGCPLGEVLLDDGVTNRVLTIFEGKGGKGLAFPLRDVGGVELVKESGPRARPLDKHPGR
jgi:hypothetical protein